MPKDVTFPHYDPDKMLRTYKNAQNAERKAQKSLDKAKKKLHDAIKNKDFDGAMKAEKRVYEAERVYRTLLQEKGEFLLVEKIIRGVIPQAKLVDFQNGLMEDLNTYIEREDLA